MITLAVDASKYTISPPPIAAWQANGVNHVIIQSHPAGYGQGRSLELMRAVAEAGMTWDAYIYQYLAYYTWTPDALATLDLAAAEGLVPRKVYIDVEDNSDLANAMTVARRIDGVQRDIDSIDAWTAAHGRPIAAIYSAWWYWVPWLANTTIFSDRHLWLAQYDNDPDTNNVTLFGGWASCRIKQYAGSQPDGTDLDSLSDEEVAELSGGDDVTDPEREAMQETINVLVSTIGLLVGDDMKPLLRKNAGQYVKDYVNVARARADAVGVGHI